MLLKLKALRPFQEVKLLLSREEGLSKSAVTVQGDGGAAWGRGIRKDPVPLSASGPFLVSRTGAVG